MRPRSIELFEKVYLGGMVFGLIIAALRWDEMSATFNTPELKSLGAGSGLLIFSIVISVIFSLVLWYFIARRASNIGKWIYVVISAFAVFSVISAMVTPSPNGLMVAGNLITMGLQVFAGWLLFKPDAVAWLESKGADGPGDPSTFD